MQTEIPEDVLGSDRKFYYMRPPKGKLVAVEGACISCPQAVSPSGPPDVGEGGFTNKLISTSDIETCCCNDSILTINDDRVGINIKPFLGCKIPKNNGICMPMPFLEPILRKRGNATAWNKFAEPFGDIDEPILTEESSFICENNGWTKVRISDPGQEDLRVGDDFEVCEKSELYVFIEAADEAFGPLSKEQLTNVELIIDAFIKYGDGDSNKLAYILGTINKESSFDSNYREGDSVAGWRNASPPHTDARRGTLLYNDYVTKSGLDEDVGLPENGKYYFGKGFIQLTWAFNYKKFSDLINNNLSVNIDMVDNPDLAFNPEYGAFIAVYGMMNGEFTSAKLDTYINGNQQNFKGARAVVGGYADPDYITFTQNVLREYEDIIDTLPPEEEPIDGLANLEDSSNLPDHIENLIG